MIQNSNLLTGTLNRNDLHIRNRYLDQETYDIVCNMKDVVKDDEKYISNSLKEICDNIFEKTDVDEIDITIRLIDEKIYIVFTSEGILYNPYSDENLMKSEDIQHVSKMGCKFEYDNILGFNKTYFILEN